jgi:hypothetical protein
MCRTTLPSNHHTLYDGLATVENWLF